MSAYRRQHVILGSAIVAIIFLAACSGRLAVTPAIADINPVPIRLAWLGLAAPARTLTPAIKPVTVALTTPSPRGPLVGWPVAGRISQGFGCSPFYTGIPGPGCPGAKPWFHDGLDLAAPEGTPVRAALSGTVIFAGPDGTGPACGPYRGYGLGVVVDSGDGWQTLYAHLSRIDVRVGQTVSPETIIGAVGQTGCVTGPHLHFGLRRQETLVDPQEYLTER